MCRSRQLAMRTLAILISAVSVAAQQPVRNPRTSPEDIALGAKTFRSHCAPCHGDRGDGGIGATLATPHLLHAGDDVRSEEHTSELQSH